MFSLSTFLYVTVWLSISCTVNNGFLSVYLGLQVLSFQILTFKQHVRSCNLLFSLLRFVVYNRGLLRFTIFAI